MNLLPEQLQLFVCDSLNPQKFAGHHFSNKDFEKWQVFLTKEIAALRSSSPFLTEPKDRKGKAAIVSYINLVVDLSNIINNYLTKLQPVWKAHPQAKQIRANYIYSINAFEELFSAYRRMFPRLSELVKVSNYSLPQVKMALKLRLNSMTEHLNLANLDYVLKELVLSGFAQLIQQNNLRAIDEAFLKSLANLILDQKELDTLRFMDLLIVNDFNTPEFFLYCVHHWRDRMTEIPGLHEQQEMILTEKDRLYNLHLMKGLKMPDASTILYKDLDQFLMEKGIYIKHLLRIRREAVLDKGKANAGIRFLMNLPVPQFGLFIRMQIEKGLLPKENIHDLFSFFALHFYTPNTTFMSADSLQKNRLI